MSKDELTAKIEELASTVMMSDPHNLQAVNRLIELFEEIAKETAGEVEDIIKNLAQAAINLAEEMIIQQGEEADNSMRILGETVTAIQVALRDGPEAALDQAPKEIGFTPAEDSLKLPSNVDRKIFSDFLNRLNR